MGDGYWLEAGWAAASQGDGVAAEELVEEGLGLHGCKVDAEAHVGASAKGIVEARVLFVLGAFWAES